MLFKRIFPLAFSWIELGGVLGNLVRIASKLSKKLLIKYKFTLKSAPTYWISLSIMPVFTWMMFIGIRPNKVAIKNLDKGTLRIGDEILMKKFGTIGVILKNSR